MNGKTFIAPWGKTLRWISALSTLLLLAVFAAMIAKTPPSAGQWLPAIPLLILAGAALFVIRDYTIEPRELLIRRLLWTTHVPLEGLKSAAFEPKAMRGSLRLCGNGGLFSFTGWYRNRALGGYRAFVTELNHTVVLRFEKKTVIVSPENPERFAGDITNRLS